MKIGFDKIKWQFIVIFIVAIFAGMGTGFDAKAASSQCQLVYKLGEEYQTVNNLGNSSSVKVERNREFYLKYEIDREMIAGSTVKIYVENKAGDAEMIAKVICASVNEDYYYDTGEHCAYIPISLKGEKGSIKVYFDITLANGTVKEKYESGSEKAFFLDLLGEYTVSYDANGGTDAPEPQTKYAESPLELTTEEPVREGYIFKGWAESSAAVEASYHPGDIYTESRGKTLFAVWKLDLRPVVNGPEEQSVKAGESAAFHVTAEGDHPDCYSYQWYYAGSQYGAGTMLVGETNSNLVIAKDKVTPQLDQLYYYCVVYDSYSDEYVESSRAKLIVNSEPVVTGPTEQIVKEGEAVSFHVTASGGNPSDYTYQWYYALSQSDAGVKIDEAESSVYSIPRGQVTVNLDGRYYYCVVSNSIYYVTSSRAKLTVEGIGVSDSNEDSNNGSNGNNNTSSNSNNGSNENSSNNGGGSENSNKTETRKTQKITASSCEKEYGSKPFYLKAKTNGNGKLTYSSSNCKVASISSKGKVTVKKYGTAVITIRASETAKYRAASKKVKIKVVPKRAQIAEVKSPEKGMVEIIWKDNKTVTGYKVRVSYKIKNKLIRKTEKYPRTQKGIAYENLYSGKTYSVKICSYVKVGKSKYYGPWSKVKKVKIK
ncbi:MAG: hypothetical protein HFH82_14160 [Lachnospiraceae bacterium]|nr:hypothetical protein [Lachnospiraceae bacterium]